MIVVDVPLLVAIGGIIAGLGALFGKYHERNKPKVDAAIAADTEASAADKLTDAALRMRQISEDEANRLRDRNDALRQRLDEVSIIIDDQEKRIRVLEEKVSHYMLKITALEADVSRLDSIVALRDLEIAKLKDLLALPKTP